MEREEIIAEFGIEAMMLLDTLVKLFKEGKELEQEFLNAERLLLEEYDIFVDEDTDEEEGLHYSAYDGAGRLIYPLS